MFGVRVLLASVAVCLMTSQLPAEDWPQWRGPNRDGIWKATGIIEKFPASGPNVLWRKPTGLGYAGPAVVGSHVYVADYILDESTDLPKPDPGTRNKLQGKERIRCLDAKTGDEIWKYEYDCSYFISYPSGPRVTPTVDGELLFALGAEGNLVCLNAKTGTKVWAKELKKEYGIEAPVWGFAGHPLVDGERLICLVGGEGSVAVAFNKKTGKELWKALSASEPGYCPPTMIEAGNTRQLLIWHADAMNSLNPETGEVYWSEPLKPSYGMSIMSPLKYQNYLFASGIGSKAALFELDPNKPAAKAIWRNNNPKESLFAANSTPIIEDGIMYGCDCRPGALRAVELKTGKRLWETYAPTTGTRRAGHGTAFIVKNGDRYFLMSETGHLVIAKLSPEKYEEISRVKLLEPTGDAFGRAVVWSHPAFANKCIYARNDKEIVCVSLAVE